MHAVPTSPEFPNATTSRTSSVPRPADGTSHRRLLPRVIRARAPTTSRAPAHWQRPGGLAWRHRRARSSRRRRPPRTAASKRPELSAGLRWKVAAPTSRGASSASLPRLGVRTRPSRTSRADDCSPSLIFKRTRRGAGTRATATRTAAILSADPIIARDLRRNARTSSRHVQRDTRRCDRGRRSRSGREGSVRPTN